MIPPFASFVNGLSCQIAVSPTDVERLRQLKEGVLGWSEMAHYVVFRELLKAKPNANILVIGVYHGLDLRYLQGIADDLGQKIRLTGVDLFEDKECADWMDDKKGKGLGWEAGTGCPAPSLESSRKNCPSAILVKQDSVSFMEQYAAHLIHEEDKFDLIWQDGAHDQNTVSREIVAALPILKPGGFIGGDDYVWGMPTGGVDRAVQALLPRHIVMFQRLWLAQP